VLKMLLTPVRRAMLAVLLCPGLAAAATGLDLQEGYWETKVTVGVQGGILPLPVIKSGKCITRQDPLPNSVESSKMHCRVFDKAIDGNDVSWRLECGDDKGKMEGQAKITYMGDQFTGNMDALVTQVEGNRHAKLEYVMKGARVRACRATDPR
jgi:hypothetical protein